MEGYMESIEKLAKEAEKCFSDGWEDGSGSPEALVYLQSGAMLDILFQDDSYFKVLYHAPDGTPEFPYFCADSLKSAIRLALENKCCGEESVIALFFF
jgi:hypothetical protein